MQIGKPADINSSEITPESVYVNRRAFMRAGVLAASVIGTGLVYRKLNRVGTAGVTEGASAQKPLQGLVRGPVSVPATTQSVAVATSGPAKTQAVAEVDPPEDRGGFFTDEKQTPLTDVTHYNNFYEFSTDKEEVARVAQGFVARPWTVVVDGLLRKPKTFGLDELLNISPPEERVYRMRCVEGWSMVIPWAGFSLARLLRRVEPLASAKYVAFTTLKDEKRFPNQRRAVLDWPYLEGLRMDEAMHPLAILASGLYGRELPAQNGAPLRLVVPWKYGFKGIKSIVRITLTEKEPPTTWSAFAPNEYGFYANVNPTVDHPRWSQATEQRLGEFRRRATLMFNGYGEQVARLYAGMDLRANY